MAAIGQPFLLNAPAKLAAVWFGENERVIAITIAIVFQTLGDAIGFVLPSLYVTVNDTDEEFKDNIKSSLVVQAVVGILIFLACLFLFKNRPKIPPTPTAF